MELERSAATAQFALDPVSASVITGNQPAKPLHIPIKSGIQSGINLANTAFTDNFTNSLTTKTNSKENETPIEGLLDQMETSSLRNVRNVDGNNSSVSPFFNADPRNQPKSQQHDYSVHHRQKRYLLFPEGSSFQLVFDLIIPIVDYTNFAIMGITCAVAWELPSKPPSEIIDHFRDKLNDGTFGLQRRNDTVQSGTQYIEKKVDTSTTSEQNATATFLESFDSFAGKKTTGNMPFPPTLYPPSMYTNYNLPYGADHDVNPPYMTPPTYHPQYNRHWFDGSPNPYRFYRRNSTTSQANSNTRLSNHYNAKSTQYYVTSPPAGHNDDTFRYYRPQLNQYSKHSGSEQFGDSRNRIRDQNWQKGNWWQRNKDRVQQNWRKYQHLNGPRLPVNEGTADVFDKKKDIPQPNGQYTRSSSYRSGRQRKILQKPLPHRIYPIFLKRRRRRHTEGADSNLNNHIENIHLKEHLTSRAKLYKKIEKMYKAQGHNGTECVMRALCETGHRQHHSKPESFVMELLRAMFALPAEIFLQSRSNLQSRNFGMMDHVTRHYWEAFTYTSNCAQRFPMCQHTIWDD